MHKLRERACSSLTVRRTDNARRVITFHRCCYSLEWRHLHGRLLSHSTARHAKPARTRLRPTIDSTAPLLIAQLQREQRGLTSSGNEGVGVRVRPAS